MVKIPVVDVRSQAFQVTNRKIVAGVRMTLVRSLLEPLHGLLFVLFHAYAGQVPVAEFVLGRVKAKMSVGFDHAHVHVVEMIVRVVAQDDDEEDEKHLPMSNSSLRAETR